MSDLAYLLRGSSKDTEAALIERRMTIQYVVRRKIFCDMSQQVLDERTAVILEDKTGTSVLGAMTPAEWEKWRDVFLEKFPDARVQTWDCSTVYQDGAEVTGGDS